MPAVTSPTPAPGLIAPAPTVAQNGQGTVPFRRATRNRYSGLISDSTLLGTSEVPFERVIEGTGYMSGIDLHIAWTASSGGVPAGAAVSEDAPWNFLSSVVLRDVGPDVINLDGYALWLINRYGGLLTQPVINAQEPTVAPYLYSADGAVFNVPTAAANQLTAGSAWIRVPVAINKRNLIGLMGNQDRAVKYQLRTNVAPYSAAAGPRFPVIWTTAPTTLPTITVERVYDYFSVPSAVNDYGAQQEQVPPGYGIIHYLTSLYSETPPAASSTLNHFIRRLGNTLRYIILVFRNGTAGAQTRASAETQLANGTTISFKLGDDVLFTESYQHRRYEMWRKYGFDAPKGVLVYDFMTDFDSIPGFEIGDEWLNTQNVVNAQFQIAYGSGWSGAPTLQMITDDLYIPPGLNPYALTV